MKKDFDSVELQREIREKLQKDFENKPELRRKKLLEIQAKYGIVRNEIIQKSSRLKH